MRQLIINKNPDKKGLVLLEGKDYRYLRQVLRVKVGDMVALRFPDGSLSNSTVTKIDENSKKIQLQICAQTEVLQNDNGITRGVQAVQLNDVISENIEYTLFQFIPKPQKLEIIIRQATECGVKNIVPVISEYTQKGSVASITDGRIERLERIVREARQQSGSPVDTKIYEPVDVHGAFELWQNFTGAADNTDISKNIGIILSERGEETFDIREVIEKIHKDNSGKKPARIALVCGNEGGISPDELEFFVKKGLFYPVHFSVNILRCETAALYGIAAVQSGV